MAALMAAAALPISSPAHAQRLNGLAELQYDNLDRVAYIRNQETWGKTIQLDYSRRLGGDLDFSSRVRIFEGTRAGVPDRVRVPEARLALAHRFFGLTASYRPVESRDALSQTTRNQNLTLTGYAQKQGLPSLMGSWIRTHHDATGQIAGTGTVSRNLASTYDRAMLNFARLNFRAGYGDRLLEPENGQPPRMVDNHANVGTTAQFSIGRAPTSVLYDYIQSHSNPTGKTSRTTVVHSAGVSSSMEITPKTAGNAVYNFRRVMGLGTLDPSDFHDGSAALSHWLFTFLNLSGSAGLRSTVFPGQQLTERYLLAGASASGRARPDWRMNAAVSRSLNWLPGAGRYTIDNLQGGTDMRFTSRFTARADGSVSASTRPIRVTDPLGINREKTAQFGVGATARPLRTVYLDGSVRRGRSGLSYWANGNLSTTYIAQLRFLPTTALQLTGNWQRTEGSGGLTTSSQSSLQWSLTPRTQLSGNYNRSQQNFPSLVGNHAVLQESYSAALGSALGRDMNAYLRYSETNRGQATHLRQVTANLSLRFGG